MISNSPAKLSIPKKDIGKPNATQNASLIFKNKERNILDRLRFLSIVASNFDEFFEVRVGSLYNYIDSNKKRIDYSGLRENPFREYLLKKCKDFFEDFNTESLLFVASLER